MEKTISEDVHRKGRKKGVLLKGLTPEEIEACKNHLDQGRSWKEIARRMSRPEGSIYHHFTMAVPGYTPRRKRAERIIRPEIDYEDFSSLPDNVLFNPKNFPAF